MQLRFRPMTAYVDPLAVGDPRPSSPLFLDAGLYVPRAPRSNLLDDMGEVPGDCERVR